MTNPIEPLRVSAMTATCALGTGVDAIWRALLERRPGLRRCDFPGAPTDTWIGPVDAVESERLGDAAAAFDCRNNRLAQLAVRQDRFDEAVAGARSRHGAARVGLFVGTSTSGLLQTELAYRDRSDPGGTLPAGFDYARTHNTYSLGRFLKQRWDLHGPAWVQSTACASSAKVFGSALRAVRAGLIDAAVVGGVDTLCLTTLHGFGSLELLSSEPCRPFDAARNGISIAEAGAFVLLERAQARDAAAPLGWLRGVGESSDAYHMSTPHPAGEGARAAMLEALAAAALPPSRIGYVNLHGTATPSNDAAEDAAVFAVFGDAVPVSSTKGAHGHTLGAAGALEAVIALLCLQHQHYPGGMNTETVDPALRSRYVTDDADAALEAVMSNSFGFGGANCSLVFAREPA